MAVHVVDSSPTPLPGACWALTLVVVAQVRRRNTTAMTGDRRDGQGRLTQVERYKLQIPWEEPWDDRMLWEHPAVMALLAQLWGSEDFELTDYSSNCPSPGSEYQQARPLPPVCPRAAQPLTGLRSAVAPRLDAGPRGQCQPSGVPQPGAAAAVS